jgi:hypothetical protein
VLADPHTPRRAPAPHLPTAAPWPPPHADGVMPAQGSRSDERRCRAQRRRKAAAREGAKRHFCTKTSLGGRKKVKGQPSASAACGGWNREVAWLNVKRIMRILNSRNSGGHAAGTPGGCHRCHRCRVLRLQTRRRSCAIAAPIACGGRCGASERTASAGVRIEQRHRPPCVLQLQLAARSQNMRR